MATVPIPQGANIQDEVPIPSGASVQDEESPSRGSMAEISARKGGVEEWLSDLEGDIKTGGGMTAVGRFLQKIGYQPPGDTTVGRMMASPLSGSVKVARGNVQAYKGVAHASASQTLKGIGTAVEGIGEAGTLPALATMGPQAEGLAAGASRLTRYLSGEGTQAELQQGIRKVLSLVSKESGVTESAAPSIRSVAEETGDAVLAKSKAAYQQIDAATGGKFNRFSDALKRIDQQIAEVADIDPDKEAALVQRRGQIQQAMEKTFDEAKAGGLDETLIEQAKTNWKKANALYDLDKQINMSTSGFRKGLVDSGKHTPEIVDAQRLTNRLEKLYKTGRLQEALGDDNATELMKQADSALVRSQKAQALVKTAKKVGAAGLAGAGAGAGIKLAHDALQ